MRDETPVLRPWSPKLFQHKIIKDITKGKAIYWFENVDIYEAKKVLVKTCLAINRCNYVNFASFLHTHPS